MASKPTYIGVQDMPPKGGYPNIPVVRGIRPRGPPGWFIWAAVLGSTMFGFYQIGKTNERNRLRIKETREARMSIIPFLQAEKDRAMIVTLQEQKDKEAEIMKHNKDWVPGESVYSKRWNYPQVYTNK